MVGLAVYFIEVVVIFVSQKFGAGTVMAVAVSYWVGFLISFLLQKFLTFSDKRTHRSVLLPQIVAYALLVIFNFAFTIVMTKIFEKNLSAIAIRSITLFITAMWNYYIFKTSIFKINDNSV